MLALSDFLSVCKIRASLSVHPQVTTLPPFVCSHRAGLRGHHVGRARDAVQQRPAGLPRPRPRGRLCQRDLLAGRGGGGGAGGPHAPG